MTAEVKISIRKEFLNTAIAFGRSGIVLKDRSLLELVELGIIARSSNNPNLLKMFDQLPDMTALKLTKIRMLEEVVKTKLNAGKTNIKIGQSS